MNCPHGINIKHKRCYDCEDIAEAELRKDVFNPHETDRQYAERRMRQLGIKKKKQT